MLSRFEYKAFEIFKIRLHVEYDEKPKVCFYFQETQVKTRALSFIPKWYRILFKISWEKEILEPVAVIRNCECRPPPRFSVHFYPHNKMNTCEGPEAWSRVSGLDVLLTACQWRLFFQWNSRNRYYLIRGHVESPCLAGSLIVSRPFRITKMQKRQSLCFTGLDSTLWQAQRKIIVRNNASQFVSVSDSILIGWIRIDLCMHSLIL